jgi:succinate dehydrogenase flavin-adding protein (antitoxin of CptAB toxin-antitoxin module)
MKELDLVLVRYLDRRWADASADEKAAFEQVLALPDPDLAAYLLGQDDPPPELRSLVEILRSG